MDSERMRAQLKVALEEVKEKLDIIDENGWKISNEDRAKLEAHRDAIQGRIDAEKEYRDELSELQSDRSEALAEYETASESQKAKLIEEIRKYDFDINALNGIVDTRVERRDKHQLKEAEKNLKEIAKQELLNKLAEKLAELHQKLEELQKLQKELAALDPNDPDYDNKKRQIEGQIDNLKTDIKTLGDGIKEITQNLKDNYGLTNLQIDYDYDNPESIDLDKMNKSTESIKNSVKRDLLDPSKKEKYKKIEEEILERYRIEGAVTTLENGEARRNEILQAMDGRIRDIRSNFIPQRVNYMARNTVSRDEFPDNSFGVPNAPRRADMSAPTSPNPAPGGVAGGTPAGGRPAPISPNPAPGGAAGGTPAGGRPAPTSPSPAPVATGATRSGVSPLQPIRSDDDTYNLRGTVQGRFKVPYNLVETIESDSAHPIKIEDGKVYRFVHVDDEVVYVCEDIEQYMDNPEKGLKRELNNLRDRMIEAAGGEKQLKSMCEEMGDTTFTKLVSGKGLEGMLKRKGAKDDLLSDLDDDPIQQLQMLIALKSAVTPKQVNEVLEKTANPYKYPSDLIETIAFEEHKVLKYKGPRIINKEKTPLYTPDPVSNPASVDPYALCTFPPTKEEMGITDHAPDVSGNPGERKPGSTNPRRRSQRGNNPGGSNPKGDNPRKDKNNKGKKDKDDGEIAD